ncbi:MAG: 50S ribosomal protein L3 [Oligoflexia bacterium]|nr:50S ribosomal protein L3 [Oligoflexia bacterium]
MSEEAQETKTETTSEPTVKGSVILPDLIAFKVGMTQVVDDKGEMVPCTVLQYEPWVVSQVKTKASDGYEAVQIACRPRREVRSPKSQSAHLKKANFKSGAYFVREVRTSLPEGVAPGSQVALDSFKKGDWINATAVSKGKGFQGAMKRWNAHGGPAAHGSCFHRQPGSAGNRTWPGRIMKGKHFPGHLGDETVTVRNLQVVDIYQDDNIILISGCVPGGRNAIVRLAKHA